MSESTQPYAPEKLVKLTFKDELYLPAKFAVLELTPDEARLLASSLIQKANDAERPEKS